MLILTRKIDEEIKIGTEITIKILTLSDNQVKVGISAPGDIQIYRGEVYHKVKQNTVDASLASINDKIDLTGYKIKKVK
ncbi:MAG: carbon storage regulator CsrA [Ignavibacteriales bacterium]|nr:carbon storage regulator CsrA [Ignavibacteriales bacterium]